MGQLHRLTTKIHSHHGRSLRQCSSASTWAKQQDGGHRAKVYLNIHNVDTWYIVIWSSTSARMSTIILPADPTVHHHLLPEVLSHNLTYVLNIGKRRVELRSHLPGALQAVSPFHWHIIHHIFFFCPHLEQDRPSKIHVQEVRLHHFHLPDFRLHPLHLQDNVLDHINV